MNNRALWGIVLVVIGVVLLAYQGFSFTRKEKILELGPIQATQEKTEVVPIPPIIGAVITAAGAALLLTGWRKSKA